MIEGPLDSVVGRRPGITAIRKLEPADTDVAIRLWVAACEQSHAFLPAQFLQATETKLRGGRLLELDTHVFDEGGVRGYISLCGNDIDALFVDPLHQGKGIGQQLLAHAKARATMLTLGAFANNARGIRFYRQQGFAIVHTWLDTAAGHSVHIMKWARD